MQYHPDRNANRGTSQQAEAEQRFRNGRDAFEALKSMCSWWGRQDKHKTRFSCWKAERLLQTCWVVLLLVGWHDSTCCWGWIMYFVCQWSPDLAILLLFFWLSLVQTKCYNLACKSTSSEELYASNDADYVLAFSALRFSSLLSSLAITSLLSFDSCCWSIGVCYLLDPSNLI